MKSSKVILWSVIASLAMLAQAVAQTGTIRVSVPFNFNVGSQIFLAGDYLASIEGGLLAVKALDGSKSARAMTIYTGGNPNKQVNPGVVFHRYGGRYFLSQVWIAEVNVGHQLFASAEEIEYARATKQETVMLAAVRLSK